MSRHKLAGRRTVRQAHADRQVDWQAQADRQINKHRQSTGWQAHWLTGTGRQTYTDWQANTDWQADRQKDKHRRQHRFTQFLQTTVSSIPPPPTCFYLHPPHKCSMLNISMNIYTFSIHLHLHDPPLYHMKDEEFDPIICLPSTTLHFNPWPSSLLSEGCGTLPHHLFTKTLFTRH